MGTVWIYGPGNGNILDLGSHKVGTLWIYNPMNGNALDLGSKEWECSGFKIQGNGNTRFSFQIRECSEFRV